MEKLIVFLCAAVLGIWAWLHFSGEATLPGLGPISVQNPPDSADSVASAESVEVTSAITQINPAEPPLRSLVELLTAARLALASPDPLLRERLYRGDLAKILAQNSPAAAELAKNLPNGPMREEYLRRLAQGWTRVDPSAATAWADALPDDDERIATLTDIALELGQRSPVSAVALAETHALGGSDHGSNQSSTWENLTSLWAARDLPAATAWALQRPEGEVRELILARIVHAQAQSQPVEAAAFILDEMQPGPVFTETVIAVLQTWGGRDPAAAGAWVAGFAQGVLRERAERELAGLAAARKAAAVR